MNDFERAELEAFRIQRDLLGDTADLADQLQALRAENERLRAELAEFIVDAREQASADEHGWSVRHGNNLFNEGAAAAWRDAADQIEAILEPAPPGCVAIPTVAAPPTCKECNGTGWRECHEEAAGHGGFGGTTECECPAGRLLVDTPGEPKDGEAKT